jgi:hypothetical protein
MHKENFPARKDAALGGYRPLADWMGGAIYLVPYPFKELVMRKSIVMLLLTGLFATHALALNDAISVKLEAQNNSGQDGIARLTPEGDTTRVVIEIPNMPAGVSQPAHIHLGRCGKLNKAPKWRLEEVKDGRSLTVVPVPLDVILKEKSAINVHKSAAEMQIYVSCGNITGAIQR